ncbi:esterase-like activity of phytase-domain-containing protein [Pseudomassariella vexata]|uniref:Esterase-like activity of phytase-domain-containing protein n=1 Tax=Pseudomassariella vexata TaxID=1141098 RepID=A0A1Y2DYP2_9PEZI|nr:esterase-like activity of phytase-domain-containing protein [Pseudomassariella vexata]ORY64412.1 esterase-like activity of phytase-domain-containing protein [Pseudomassariella vexata]
MAAVLLTAALAVTTAARNLVSRNTTSSSRVNSTTCNGEEYVYEELAGYGFVISDAVDKFGDTLGGLGSAIHLEKGSWSKLSNGSYTGTLWTMPDRGWNTQGTLNFQPRVHKFTVAFHPAPNATVENHSPPNLALSYLDTVRFSGPDDTPCTGLDGDVSGHLSYPGFPDLPVATYTGDGFGGEGPGGKRIAVDPEGLAVNEDGSFWVSDEYGPYVYLFDQTGKMLTAIRPPDAIIPTRNGTESFSSASPPQYIDNGNGPLPDPEDPDTGRDNNHGFEGISVSEDGNSIWVFLQAATVQEGGLAKQTQRWTRLLKYDISSPLNPLYVAEYVVPLPAYNDPTAKPSKNPKIAAQSELHALPNGQFFVLARDSDAGRGMDNSLSVYRQIDVVDISTATDIKAEGGFDCETCAVASFHGVLDEGITPAVYCGFLDFNVNSQLGRFGLHNGGEQDAQLLNEKWESITVVPVEPKRPGDDYFVFSLSDNDFITQNGFTNGGQFQYADASGFNLDSQALVFKVKIPS